VASGVFDIVLSGGVETTGSRPKVGKPSHMREAIPQAELWDRTNYGADQAYWYFGALAMPSLLDFPVMQYAKKYGLTLEQIGEVLNAASISNRRNALLNPRAVLYKKSFQEEAKDHGFNDVMEYMRSNFNPKIGTIMRAFNGASVVDGASALIVCPTEMAKKFNPHPIEVIGFGSATSVGYHDHEYAHAAAFAQAYEMAKINPYRDIDYMHVHDCLIGAQITVTEQGGYFRPGEAWRAILDGRTGYDGDRPLSTSGGRPSLGHAWSASAGAEIAEAVWQMREQAGARQVKPTPEVSVIHNLGHGIHANVSVLRQPA